MSGDDERIPFNRPFLAGAELEHLARAATSGESIAGDGPYARRCQEWLEERLGTRRALLTPSCTAALEIAALLADIGPGDEVLMPSFTYPSTANAFALRGARPVFVDIREDTLGLDAALLEPALSARTRAIVPVHYAGTACDMEAIAQLAERRDLVVIEDAAEAFLSTWRGRALGTLGQLGCLSFHETKNLVCGEGGALLVNDERLVERAEIARDKGTDRARFLRGEAERYTWVDLGSSHLAGDLVAAFLWAQLEAAEHILADRARAVAHYREMLEPLARAGHLRLPQRRVDCESHARTFHVLTGSAAERARLIEHLRAHGIQAVFHYLPLHASPAGKRFGRAATPLPVTERTAERILRLPLYHGIAEAELERVCARVREFYAR
jgi:dTDP-4-amino-4,6-dideoxygalactose transaminase